MLSITYPNLDYSNITSDFGYRRFSPLELNEFLSRREKTDAANLGSLENPSSTYEGFSFVIPLVHTANLGSGATDKYPEYATNTLSTYEKKVLLVFKKDNTDWNTLISTYKYIGYDPYPTNILSRLLLTTAIDSSSAQTAFDAYFTDKDNAGALPSFPLTLSSLLDLDGTGGTSGNDIYTWLNTATTFEELNAFFYEGFKEDYIRKNTDNTKALYAKTKDNYFVLYDKTSQALKGENLLYVNISDFVAENTNKLLKFNENLGITLSDATEYLPLHLSRSTETLESGTDTSSYLGFDYGSNFVSNTDGYLITNGPVVVMFDQKLDAHNLATSELGNSFSYVDPYHLWDETKGIFQIVDNSASGIAHPDTGDEVGATPTLKKGVYNFDYSLLLYSDKIEYFPFDVEFKLWKRCATSDLGGGVGVAIAAPMEKIIFSQTDYRRVIMNVYVQIVNDDTQVFLTVETSLGSGGIQILSGTYSRACIKKIVNNPK